MQDNSQKNATTKREEEVFAFWQKNKIFEKSEEGLPPKSTFAQLREKLFGKKEFVFYDGPPFATGLPHFGHFLVGIAKDVIPRYKTMRGYKIRRQWGWDCHGLPIEVEIEKELGLKNKKELEEYGIENFNNKVREKIFQYVDAWKERVPRIGRWIDMENDYRTLNASFIESVWHVFHRLYEKGYVKESFRVIDFCPRCSTTLSNNEVAEGYMEKEDIAVYVTFPLKDDPNTFFVAWTTTPWTLFGNVALAVHNDLEYLYIKKEGKTYVVNEIAKDIIDGEVIKKVKGSDLVGLVYEPLFDMLHKHTKSDTIWKVYAAEYVTADAGTGIVHIAPAYGKEDYEVAEKYNLPIRHHVDTNGLFTENLGVFAKMQIKDEENLTDKKIVEELKKNGRLLKDEIITHNYPHCWRCKTPLVKYASESWDVLVPKFRDRIIQENKGIHWVPGHLKEGRFGKWIAESPNWNISRDRFWGAPIPVWKNKETGKLIVADSIKTMMSKMKMRNTYIFVRHGEAQSNIKDVFNCVPDKTNTLTELGHKQAEEMVEVVKKYKPTKLYASPLTRTVETAKHIADACNLKIIEDERVIETQRPKLEGKSIDEYFSAAKEAVCKGGIHAKIADGESYGDAFKRMLAFFEDIDKAHEGEVIIVVTHVGPIYHANKIQKGEYLTVDEICNRNKKDSSSYFKNTECLEVAYKHLPRDENGEVDMHRPFIDNIVLYDEEGLPYHHIGKVFDCWFESGSMPYASKHYPFENLAVFNPEKKKGFPADFICEAMDQTRGWFNSLLAVGVGAFNSTPYKNVISTGLILAEGGKKMSKSEKNFTDPMEVVDLYGADTMRHYLMASPAVQGHNLIFKDEDVASLHRKVYGRLHNCLQFYLTYAHLPHASSHTSDAILDMYIVARLSEMREQMTTGFENYEINDAVAPLFDFVDELSTWYLRLSREVLKDSEKGKQARATFQYVLFTLSKLFAPVAPFYAEHMYQALKKYVPDATEESVHLSYWPEPITANKSIVAEMQTVIDIVSEALNERQKVGLPVRQPLTSLTITKEVSLSEVLQQIIAQEVQVEHVYIDASAGGEQSVLLDTTLTADLKEKGFINELKRAIQDVRKEKKCDPLQELAQVTITVDNATQTYTPRDKSIGDEAVKVIEKHAHELQKVVRTKKIHTQLSTVEPTHTVQGVKMQITLQ